MVEKNEFDASPLPTHDHLFDDYTRDFSERDRTAAEAIADQLFDAPHPLARCQVLIPVAAHQEAAQIENTLAQYARQQTDQPFSVILSLNSPASEQDNPGVIDTLQQVELAKIAHPDLDLRTALTFYERPTIGMIRRDLWNGALLASTYGDVHSTLDNDIIGINHDIDTVTISPRYIQRIQAHYTRQRHNYDTNGRKDLHLPSVGTMISHALSPAHPNISKGIRWSDFNGRQLGGTFEAGIAIPFRHYMHAGGFPATAVTHETRKLWMAGNQEIIPHTIMQTSPRRYIDRLGLQDGFDGIWSDKTFGAHDTCRTMTNQPDITHEQLEAAIADNDGIKTSLQQISITAITNYLQAVRRKHPYGNPTPSSPHEIEEILISIGQRRLARQRTDEVFDKKARLIAGVLSRMVESQPLANTVQSLQNDDTFRRSILEQYNY